MKYRVWKRSIVGYRNGKPRYVTEHVGDFSDEGTARWVANGSTAVEHMWVEVVEK